MKRTLRRLLPVVSGMAAAALVLAGCSSSEPSGPTKTTFVVSSPYATESLDPHGVNGAGIGTSHPSSAIFSRLVFPDTTGNLQADLAETWEGNADATEWTFHLRKDAVFSDGTPVTAEDVKASLERVIELDGPIAGNFTGYVATVKDANTVVMSSTKPILLGLVSLLYVAKKGVTDTDFATAPIGSGPYTVKEFSPGETLILTPNPKYYGTVPTVDVEFRWIPEMSTRLTALQTGEIDATWGIPDDQVAALEADSDLVVQGTPTAQVVSMWFNSSRPALSSAAVRNAIWQAVDFETIIEALFPNSGSLADSPIAPSILGYASQAAKTYDPEGSKAALEDAGFDFNQTLQIQYKEAEYTQFLQAIVSDLSKIGVRIELVQKEAAVWTADLLALNWDINFQLLGTAGFDAAQNLGRLYTCAANRNGYCNPELDSLLADAGSISDTDRRVELYAQAGKIIWDDAVGMWPMFVNVTYAWRANVAGFAPDPLQQPNLNNVSFTS